MQRIISNAVKPRFQLRQTPNDPSPSWEISRISTSKEGSPHSAATSPIPTGDKLTPDSPDLPEFVIYETSYQRYPLLLTLGGITRAPGGSRYHSFVPVVADRDGSADARQNSEPGSFGAAASSAAEISIYIHLPTALLETAADSKIEWYRSENGQAVITTADEVPKSLWRRVVARRPDVGVVFEDGEVRKDLPAGLRGKAAKGKGRKADRNNLKRAGSGEESDSVSEEAIEE